jgi:hypothetical protein
MSEIMVSITKMATYQIEKSGLAPNLYNKTPPKQKIKPGKMGRNVPKMPIPIRSNAIKAMMFCSICILKFG